MAETARIDPPSIEGSAANVPPDEGHELEEEPVPLLQVVDAARVPDNALVTVAVSGSIFVTVVVT
jgi:hypothetical protein